MSEPWSKVPWTYDPENQEIDDADGCAILYKSLSGKLNVVPGKEGDWRLIAEAPAMAELLGRAVDRLAEIQDTRDADTHGLVVEARALLSRVRVG